MFSCIKTEAFHGEIDGIEGPGSEEREINIVVRDDEEIAIISLRQSCSKL